MAAVMLRPLRDNRQDAQAVHGVITAVSGAPPEPADDPSPRGVRQRAFVRHLARTDPGGCWLATDDAGRPVGTALATRREGTWGLAVLGVLPQERGKGIGRELLAATLAYGRACLRGIVCAPDDPRAAATYRRAGFTLHPAMRLTGTVDRSALTAPDGAVLEGSLKDRDMLDSVDRRTRGGAHGPDHEELLRHLKLLVADDLAGSGYAYLDDEGTVELLAATSRRLATRLLTAALLLLPPGAQARVQGLTAEQEWALDVGLAAGLEIANHGYVCLRGMRPPTPYIPSGAFL
jgi:GNAT superfamily N-acetyltransferase